MSAVAMPPDDPCTSSVCPDRKPDFVNKARYAVSQAVPSTEAWSAEIPLGRGTALRRGTAM